MAVPILRLNVDDCPTIIVKQDCNTVSVTGNTYWNFTGSGCTTVIENPHGNIVDVTIYSPCVDTSVFVALSAFTSYTGSTATDIQNVVDCCTGNTAAIASHTGDTSIHFAMSAITINQSQVVDLVDDIDYIGALITGMTVDIQTNYECCTGNTADIDYHYSQFTGLTSYIYNLLVPAITGNTQDISDLNDSLTAHTSQVGAGSIHFTGHTFTASGIAVVSQTGDTINYYVPADSITGVSWNMITGKPDLTLQSDFTGHTSDLTIHYQQSAITITESQVTNLVSDLAGKSGTGHTHDYSVITNTPDLSVYQPVSGMSAYSLTGHTHSQYLTGFTVTCDMVTGCTDILYSKLGHTHEYSAITNTPDLSVYQPISGMTLYQPVSGMTAYSLTGHTHSQYLTGVTFADITDDVSGNTNLQDALDLKLDVSTYNYDINILSQDLIDLNDAIDTHTGDTTIHYVQSAITISESQVTNLVSDLAGKSGTGHTHAYSAITDTPDLSVYQPISGMTAYSLTGHTHCFTGGTITCIPDFALQSDLASHTGDTSIHFIMSAITGYSQTNHTHSYTGASITDKPDLSVYALESDLTGHTSDTSIHFKQSGITITESQVTDLPADLSYLQTEIDNLSALQSTDRIYIFENVASDIGGYETLSPTLTQVSAVTESVTVNGTQLVDSYATPATGLGVIEIPSGVWTIHFHASTNIATNANMRFDIYKRAGTGETLLFQSALKPITTTSTAEYQIEEAHVAYTGLTGTERLVAKVYVVTTQNRTVNWTYNSSVLNSYVQVPIKVTTAPLWANVLAKPSWLSGTTLSAFQSAHSHSQYSLTTHGHTTLTGLTISESQVTNLVTDLAGKSGTGHTHTGVYMPASGYTFIESGGTQISQVGDIVTIYSTMPTGLTVAWVDVTGKPALWNTGETYVAITGYSAPISHTHPQYLTGYTVTADDVTGITASLYAPIVHTHEYSAITNTPDLNAYALSGHTHAQYLTGYTVQCSDVTGCTNGLYSPIVHTHEYSAITNTPDLSVYQPISGMSVYLTGVTWNIITGDISGSTTLQDALDLKLDVSTYNYDMNILSQDLIDLNDAISSHTGDTTIHFTMSVVNAAISAATSGLTADWNSLLNRPAWLTGTTLQEFQTGHTHSYNDLDDLPTLFTGHTFVESGITQISQVGDVVTIYVSADSITGVTWASIIGDISGSTDLQAALDAKSDTGHTHAQYLTGYTVTADDVTGITATLYSLTGHNHTGVYVPFTTTIVTLTASTILNSTYAGKIVEVNSTGATTITLYSGATIGTRIDIVNINTGDVTLAAQGTLQSDGTKIATQYTGASVYARGTSTWLAVGKLTT